MKAERARGERTPSNEPLSIAIRVVPGASFPGVGGLRGESLVVRVHERAVDGRATEAALTVLAAALGVRRRDVRLVRGATSRDKIVAVDRGHAEVVRALARLRELNGTEETDGAPRC